MVIDSQKRVGLNAMVKKENKGKKCISNDDIGEVAGGKTTSYNIECCGNRNIIGRQNITYERMLEAIDKLDKEGKLDYLKNK